MLTGMMKKVFGLCLLFFMLTSGSPAEAGTFSADLGADGMVTVSGSDSFECMPEEVHIGAWAVIRVNGVTIDQVGSSSSSLSFTKHYNFSCKAPGTYEFSAFYDGYEWRMDPYWGIERCTYLSGDSKRDWLYDTVYIPYTRGIGFEIRDEFDQVVQDRIKDGKKIVVDYDFAYSNDNDPINRRVTVYVGNEAVYAESYLPINGTIEIPHDFSGEEGFIAVRASKSCKEIGDTYEKTYYIEPEDSCPVKVGKPVSLSSGNVYLSDTDFALKGIVPITFTRYYDSAELNRRGFGQSWGHTYDTRIVSFGLNTYRLITPDGSDVYYVDNEGDRVYDVEFPKGERSSLIKNANSMFKREYYDGSSEEFNSAGYLTAVVDRNGNRIIITRGTNYRITKITDPAGREVNFTYNTSNKITQITLPDSRTINYIYDPASGYIGKVTYPDSSERSYEYINISGVGYRLTGIKDEKGVYIEKHDYDSQGRATTSSSDGTNELLTINYAGDTNSTVTDSFGNVTTYTLDKSMGVAHPTNISGPGCKSCGQGDTSLIYDGSLNVTSSTDANGIISTMTYDDKGNMLTKTEAYGTTDERITTYTYNEFGQVLTETDNDGIITSYTYDIAGNMLTKTEAYGSADERTATYTYNAYGQMLTVTDPNGNTTSNTYDQYGNLASVTNALNQTTTYAYDIMGNLISMTDANGNMTTYEYDLRDRLKRETRPDTGVINYEYDAAGNRTTVVDANGNRTTFTYNNINRLIKTTDPEGNSTNYTYDTESNITSMIIKDSAGNVKTSETYTYDDHNRLTRTTHLDGTYTEQTYDPLGNILTKRDGNGNVRTNSYDALNRLQSVTDQNGGITSYTYDSRNNLTSITDANENVTTYYYDNLNRLRSTASPDTGTTIYTYDDSGNLLTKTDANDVTTTYTYDALNRQTAVQFPDSMQDINYFYDDPQAQNGKGRLTLMTDPSGYTWYDYDKMGWVIKETKKVNNILYRTEYTYDLNGNVATITYPGGRVITYTYNQLNKIASVAETYIGVTRTLVSDITYQPFGDIASMSYGNGMTTTKAYDNRNRLASLLTQNSQLQTLNSFTYTRDNTGNISSITDNTNPLMSKGYTYDPLNRLTIANGQWGAITYTYDDVGNRTYETTDTGNTMYSYTANSNKLSSASGEKNLAFSYDNDGNTTAENSRQYIYDQNQRLIKTMEGGNVIGEYFYNGKGQRAEKYIPSQNKCSIFHYDQNGLMIAETTSAGNIKAEYVYLNGQPLAKIEGNNVYYYSNDHLGTPMMMTDSAGSIVWQGEFKPFGEPLSVTGSVANNLRFPGQYYDAETGLHQNYFRDYSPQLGRYAQADPIGLEGGMNPYVYTDNNPCKWIDPLGLDTYMCTKPLDALGGSGKKSGMDIWGNPAYHQYICVVNEKGVQCEGQSSVGGKAYGEGAPSNDFFSSGGCEKVATNKCIEECVLYEGSKKRPQYGLVGPNTNCQEWATDTFNKCISQCF